MFVGQIARDSMLYAAMVAPLLAACFFRFGVPYAETLLCDLFGRASVLFGYYLLFDLFLAALTPYLFCFASAMVMLTELDENMAAYMAVTPVGKRGYIVSRLLLPALIAFAVSVLLVRLFALTPWSVPELLCTCLMTSLLSAVVALLLVAFAHNRVEGMALAKIAGLLMLGLPVPFFMFSRIQYLFFALPSFWIAKYRLEGEWQFALPAAASVVLWIWGLAGRFERRLA